MSKENTAKLLRKIKVAGIKQKDLAKSVGVSVEHLNAVLKGRLTMTDLMYKRIEYWYGELKDRKHS